MKTREQILKEAEDLHFSMMDLEEQLETNEDDEELNSAHFDGILELARPSLYEAR